MCISSWYVYCKFLSGFELKLGQLYKTPLELLTQQTTFLFTGLILFFIFFDFLIIFLLVLLLLPLVASFLFLPKKHRRRSNARLLAPDLHVYQLLEICICFHITQPSCTNCTNSLSNTDLSNHTNITMDLTSLSHD